MKLSTSAISLFAPSMRKKLGSILDCRRTTPAAFRGCPEALAIVLLSCKVSRAFEMICVPADASSGAAMLGWRSYFSVPANAIDRPTTVHRCSGPYSFTRGCACNRPWAQHHARSHHAIGRIADVGAIHDGTGFLGTRGHEPGCQQRSCSERDRQLHAGLPHF